MDEVQPLRREGKESGSEAEDLRAIAETLRGNREAYRQIVDRYGAMILRLATSYLGSREDAEEASQEIFFKAYRSLHSFRLERPFLPWLYAIALNQLKTRYARTLRAGQRFAQRSREMLPEASGDPQADLAEAESSRELRAAVVSLPPDIREVVVLHYYESLGVSRIAEMLRIGEENVKSRLHRGRKILRKRLAPDATGQQ